MTENQNNWFVDDLALMVKALKTEDITKTLELLRKPLFKLSETQIPKHSFYQWKKAKYLDSLFPKQESTNSNQDVPKEWTRFSIMETVILSIVNNLWERNLGYKIKEFVDEYMLGEDFENQLKMLLQDEHNILEKLFNKSKKGDILGFIYEQKKINPHLPTMTNIEGLIIASLKLNRPHSILIYENDTIEFIVTSNLTDLKGVSYYKDLLQKSFINISIRQIVDNILFGNKIESAIGKQEPLVTKLLKIGYDTNTLNEILNKGELLEYIEEKLDTSSNIEKVFLDNRNDDQDILLKVRGGVKVSLRRIIIKPKI
jgi:hypothetical protein